MENDTNPQIPLEIMVNDAHSTRMANGKTRRKPVQETAVALNITVPPVIYRALNGLIDKHGFKGPSDYFQACVRKHADLDLVEAK